MLEKIAKSGMLPKVSQQHMTASRTEMKKINIFIGQQ